MIDKNIKDIHTGKEYSPFGAEGDKPINEWNGFKFESETTLNKFFNSIDWTRSPQELRKIKNTKIIGMVALATLAISAFFPNKVVGGVAGIISFITALAWFIRKGYISYYKKPK